MKRFTFILITIFLSLNCAFTQKGRSTNQPIKKASGTALFKLEEDMSMNDLKNKLRRQAIINAIEREYGTYVTQESFVDIDDGNTQFRIFGKTTIRGEWLKTTSEDFKEEMRKIKDGSRKKHELWMSLKIEGKVRELSQPDIQFNFFTSNCKKDVCKTSFFENGESMYFYFNSPVDGYLSIYTVEAGATGMNDNQAFRLLPYKNMPAKFNNAVPIMADKNYIFFDPNTENDLFEDFSNYLIDEMVMLTEKDEEFVELYLIFSTEEFIKPSLANLESGSKYETPKALQASMLTNWLENNRMNNENFYYKLVKLKIVN